MKNIDGYVTKDSLYRLLSNMRMNREIDENASSKVARAVADMKPVEVQPVKHGRWEVRTQKDGTTIGQHNVTYCSECGYVLFTKEDSFCARCGAKMDLKYGDSDELRHIR